MNNNKIVSVIVPAYNEINFIEHCINSMLSQDYPKELYEILIVDGMSTDGTREKVLEIAKTNRNLHLVDNPNRTVPFALNEGIKKSRGDVVVIISAHGFADPDFVRKNVETLDRVGADCVGGRIDCIANSDSANTIMLAMRSTFGIGDSALRENQKAGFVAHLAYPCYNKDVFDKIGYFDEEMVKNQDDEFNFRLRKFGGTIYFNPEIRSYYYVRPSLKALWRQYFVYGYYKVRNFQKHPGQLSLRHFVPAGFVSINLFSLFLVPMSVRFGYIALTVVSLYLTAALINSVSICRRVGFRYFYLLPITFATLHVSYGSGFLKGLIKFFPKWFKK
ncbi:glycosyltransferase family 2 protein [candidate division KSB1 bacterium]|nr:glycosyltransferase family 2 protein [candidate division KSB1 bacterium]